MYRSSGNGILEQTKHALSCVDQALAKAGSDKSRVLEVTIWLADIERDYQVMNSVYDKWIESIIPPCRACVEAKLYSKDCLVEVRVIAAEGVQK